MRKLYNRIFSNSFIKSVITLSSGVVIAQIINFFGMPVIGRLYTPDAIGDYTLVTSNATMISALATLGMMTVFMLPKEDSEARSLSRLVSYALLIISTVVIAILFVMADVFKVFNTTEISYGISLITLWLYIVVYNISNICYAYANRKKLYKVMFWNPIIAAVVNVIIGILLGILDLGFLGYTAAHILSFGVNIVHLIVHANPYKKDKEKEYTIFELIKKYKHFPIYQMPANLVTGVKTQLEAQMIAKVFSSTALGMYSMAMRILSLPLTLLATPINRVYYQEANQRYNNGQDIGEFSFKILKTNIKVAIIPIAVLIIFGEWVFAIFLGEKWREAGAFAAILGIYQLIMFCSSCLSGGFIIIRKNKINLCVALYNLFSTVIVYLISYMYISNVYITLWLMSILSIVGVIVSQGIFFFMTGIKVSTYGKFVLTYIFIPVLGAWIIKLGLF